MSETEEEGLEKKYREELYPKAKKVKTIDDFVKFHKDVMDRPHDYGSICVAVTALAVAGAWLADADEKQGGITGFQAGAIMWEFMSAWNGVEAPAKLIKFKDMLYPQYEERFQKLIAPTTWAFLQTEAAKNIAEHEAQTDEKRHVHPEVLAHWKSIVDGVVPFGYHIKKENG